MSLPLRLCRAVVARPMHRLQPVAGPSRIARRFVHDSSKRLAAAAQLAESEDQPSYYHNPLPPPSSSHQEPSRRPWSDSQYPTREPGLVRMPSPLPPDVLFADDSAQSTMYLSGGVLDSIALIAISLRRPDLVPRALLMFNQMLSGVKADSSRQIPDAEIWGKVIEGVASLGKQQTGGQDPTVWLGRAERLVGRWESMNDVATGSPALLNEGIKIYQGWMSGLLKASARLDPLLPYLSNGRIPVADMLGAIETSNLPLAFEALMELGRSSGDRSITDQVQELMGIEQQQREQQAREIEEVAEVMPVLDVSVLPTNPSGHLADPSRLPARHSPEKSPLILIRKRPALLDFLSPTCERI